MNKLTLLPLLLSLACSPPSDEDLAGLRGGKVEVYFNDPGTRPDNIWKDPDGVRAMVSLIGNAQATIDFAVMGFSKKEVVRALIAAHDRGVKLRMVGDADHIYNSGYQALIDRQIPMSLGNGPHIMHDKFMVVDDRFLFAGTANWTPSDMMQNSNNFVFIDHPGVAADFTEEFEQMFHGRFGWTKEERHNGRRYQVGDTEVEVWFSPNEDAMGRMLELVDGAQESVRFTIFAFTKDQVGSAYIRKQAELERRWADDPDRGDELPERSVAGVVDQSQLHSNGQYHEVFRLLSGGVPMRLDGNDMSRQPGDYQAGGGRLHSKTMLIDTYSEDPDVEASVITGSFNWSASATLSNDEFLIVLRSPRISNQYNEYFEYLWDSGRHMGESYLIEEGNTQEEEDAQRLGKAIVRPGDLVINEIMWYGLNSSDSDGYDEFIELRNTSDHDIRLDMWQIAGIDDFVVGIPPGSVIPAHGYFTIVDHVTEVYADGLPQDEPTAFRTGDLIVNSFNDNRQARLYLKDGAMELFLMDPRGRIMDKAGDGGPAFAGGPEGAKGYSMERSEPNSGDGTVPSSWHTCQAAEG
ncbi:MAG: phosphatidylserine/phosphatidylglycerophosphate/cardiolipin synthase-like enzyme, partial [Kiritimatiellia bacterium]